MPTFGGDAHQCECHVAGVTEMLALNLRGAWPRQLSTEGKSASVAIHEDVL